MAKPIRVLMIEDNPADSDLTKETLEESRMMVDLEVIPDGVQALDYLKNNANPPDLILLDLNLPKKDGRKVLEEIRQDVSLKYIPVVILTSSDAEKDILESYGLGANCYLTKPVNYSLFVDVVKQIENFWVTVVKLPTHKD